MYKDGLHEHSRLEEEYFYKKEREIIEKNKRSEQEKQQLLARTQHYHKCAKCGHDMEEVVKESLSMLVCHTCESVHLSLSDVEALQHQGKFKVLMMDVRDRFMSLKRSA